MAMTFERISEGPDLHDGAAHIKRLSFPVSRVLQLLKEEKSYDKVRATNPRLEDQDIDEALLYGASLIQQDSSLTAEEKAEINGLHSLAVAVFLWLVMVLIASLIAVMIVLPNTRGWTSQLHVIVICVAAGTLGSAVSALISVLERVADGWELRSGKKWPISEKLFRFNKRMALFFVARPFLGSVMGLLIYTGMVGGYLIATTKTTHENFTAEGLAFFAALGGVFAKTFLEKLRNTFESLFGKK